MLDGDDLAATGVGAGNLDRVLDGLGAGVEEGCALLVRTRSEFAELLANLYLRVAPNNHEARVRQLLNLALHTLYDPRRTHTNRRHSDASTEIDDGVAIDVKQDSAAATFHEHGEGCPDAC